MQTRVVLAMLVSLLVTGVVGPERARADFADRFTLREVGMMIGGGNSLRSGVQLYTLQPYFGLALWEPIDDFFEGHDIDAMWMIEPWVSISDDTKGSSQSTSFEVGISPIFFRLSFTDWKIRPYLEGGLGILYTELRSKIRANQTLGTRVQFATQAGLGAEYRFRPDMSFSLSVRFRHISNADIDDENPGIDTVYGLVGFTFR